MTAREFREMEQILKEQRELVSRDPVAARELLASLNILHLCVPIDTYRKQEEAARLAYLESELGVFLCN
jgi:hypothetical protein